MRFLILKALLLILSVAGVTQASGIQFTLLYTSQLLPIPVRGFLVLG
jgi:hypothetical protein